MFWIRLPRRLGTPKMACRPPTIQPTLARPRGSGIESILDPGYAWFQSNVLANNLNGRDARSPFTAPILTSEALYKTPLTRRIHQDFRAK